MNYFILSIEISVFSEREYQLDKRQTHMVVKNTSSGTREYWLKLETRYLQESGESFFLFPWLFFAFASCIK